MTPDPGSAEPLRRRAESLRQPREEESGNLAIDDAAARIWPALEEELPGDVVRESSRADLAKAINRIATKALGEDMEAYNLLERRALVTKLLNDLLTAAAPKAPETSEPDSVVEALFGRDDTAPKAESDKKAGQFNATAVRNEVMPVLLERIDSGAAVALPRDELARQIGEIVGEILKEQQIQLNLLEQKELVSLLLDEMLGLGPLEVLLADDSVTDILVNGPKQVYVERKGKLELTDVKFRDNAQLLNIANRIVSRIGRRIDESSPLVDARLEDGSRVNIIIPPLALDGATISIRKFAKKSITLDVMTRQVNLSRNMADVLRIAARCRLNVLISGGTGSGKTTLLNALSQMIDIGERIVTIEDAAELQLQQPHVVRLETRPPNLEGTGKITIRDLLKNSLRMRPDRIILGEIRGSEALDMLQAMNTGHEGSMCTIHANNPREALTRLENMVGLAGIKLSSLALRTQIASAIDLVVQVSRMRDGVRRIVKIMEVIGIEGDVVTTQDLFTYEFEGEDPEGRLLGRFESSGLRPHFSAKAEYFGLDRQLMESMQ